MRNWTTQIEMNNTEGKEYYLPCSFCSNDTKHKVLCSATYRGSASDMDFAWNESLQIVQCLGCENLSFRKATSDSESYCQIGENEWVTDEKIELFPARINGRKNFENTHYLPAEVKSIYEEARLALGNPQPILAGIGIRALVETVCKEKAATGYNLENKIDSLVTGGFLTPEGAEILHGLRFLGNDAAHEAKPHSEKTLNVAWDVVENLLTNVYILPNVAAAELKRRTPKTP